jgi:gliding motility-associated-like protein
LTGGNVVASPTLNTVTTVTYYAEAVGAAPTQCVNPVRTAITLTIKDTPNAPTSGGDIEQCVQSPIQTLTAIATAPVGATVVWYNSLSGGSVVTSPTLNAVDTVTYYAESNLNGCVSTRTPVVLTITDVPKFAIQGDCLGNDFTLKTDIEGALTYSWKDASNIILATTPTVIVKSPGTYTCTITNTDGCSTTENIAVSEVSCSIQKGISPKGVGPGDGLNDSFDLSTLNVSKLEIFNRYGSKVYSKDNYTNEWFGQSDAGNELPDGTYYYVIKLVNDPTQTGWIYINREQ